VREGKVIFINTVKLIIDAWDPIELFPYAPNDEYHSEIREIEQLLDSIKYKEELADGIYSIFMESFGKHTFHKTKNECAMIAQKILDQFDTI